MATQMTSSSSQHQPQLSDPQLSSSSKDQTPHASAATPAASSSSSSSTSDSSAASPRHPASQRAGDSSDERDALELNPIETQEGLDDNPSDASVSSGEEYQYRIVRRRTVRRPSQQTDNTHHSKDVWGPVRRFWTRHVVLVAPQKSNRDFFALERTFLSYIRTSLSFAMIGVLIAQLFRLKHTTNPAPRKRYRLDFYSAGIPLSVTCYGVAIAIAYMGAHRFFRQQRAIALGKVWVGGWELHCISLLEFLVILTIFVITVVIIAIDGSGD